VITDTKITKTIATTTIIIIFMTSGVYEVPRPGNKKLKTYCG